MISIKTVRKVFPSKQGQLKAVDDVNLDIKEGEIFGVIGYSGAGKSTLIRMLNGLELPTEGSVTVAGRVISKIKGRELRKARQEISMIFQHFNLLWSRTVSENIAFPLEIAGVKEPERQKRVNELIKLVGLEGREKAYPSQLSGGQKQRVAIARAIAAKPVAMLFDEPTSALDPELRGSVLSAMQDLAAEGMTMVVVTHEMGFARAVGHRVVFMDHGEAIEEGDARDFLSNPRTDRAKKFLQDIH
jgi:D-methionine transport system ATP-binding protein